LHDTLRRDSCAQRRRPISGKQRSGKQKARDGYPARAASSCDDTSNADHCDSKLNGSTSEKPIRWMGARTNQAE
jgi:hypothetical protein